MNSIFLCFIYSFFCKKSNECVILAGGNIQTKIFKMSMLNGFMVGCKIYKHKILGLPFL